MSFGHPHRHFRRTDSTNTRARELAAAGAPHGTVVTAAEQTEGRGRQGRSWTAPAGKALLYSAVVRPLGQRHMLLPLAVPLAACEAAEQLQPEIQCGVKWPNDVQIEGRKLAGVLIEARPQDGWAIVGVGLNLSIEAHEFPAELRDTATSLAIESGRSSTERGRGSGRIAGQTSTALDLAGATGALDRRLEAWLEAEPEAVLAAWRERDVLRGREVAWEGGSGVADGIDDRGYLVVVTGSGERVALGAGEVHLSIG
jgi:BirA family transcriptional regulator, biotin operon repressor / biotin---[acetyl-CoA-carboxylase] ligase